MSDITKVIVLDLDETLIHSYHTDNLDLMILRPNIDNLIHKLQAVKNQNIDIILCTTSRSEWVNKFFELKPVFKTVFSKIYTRDNEKEWRYFSENEFPLEYSARSKNVNLEYLKPVTTFGYDQVLYIDDNKLENIRLKILFELTQGKLNKDVTFFTGFKYFRKSVIWKQLLDYYDNKITNIQLNKKIEQLLKFEESNPGCNIMISVIDEFINKPFEVGLHLLDEIYYSKYKQYDEELIQLEKEIEQIIELEELY